MLKKNFLFLLLVITTVGFALRTYRLDSVPLRGDEAFTLQNWMSRPLSETLVSIATIEPHPFLNYVLFRVWGLLAGTSEFSARYLPALVNTLGIPAVYAFGSRLFNRRVGLVSALLWAFHPYLIWHSQDARNYAVWSALSVLALWLGLRALQINRRRDWWLYLFVVLLSANVFYFEWFSLVAFTFYAVISYWRDWSRLGQLSGVLFIVLFVSFQSFMVLQGGLIASGGYGGTTGAGLNIPELFTLFLPAFFWGETLPASASALFAAIAVVILILSAVVVYRYKRSGFLFLILLGFLPLLFLSMLSLRFDVFAPRYVLSVIPVFVVLLSFLVVAAFPFYRYIRISVVIVWFFVAFLSLYNLFCVHDYAKSKDWPDVAAYLEANVAPDDLIVQLSVDPAFGFYYNGAARDIGLPANPEQPAAAIIRELEADSSRYQSIWLVGQTFPDWPNYGVVEKWLQDNMQTVRSADISDLQVRQYMNWQVDEAPSGVLATFGDVAVLSDARVWRPPEPDGEITVWLYWRPLSRTQTPYKVFVHLEGTMNPAVGTPLWSQDDRYPQNGRISTAEWAESTIYRDVYVLPTGNVPDGGYDLRVGFYNPDTGERLLLPSGEDSYLLQTIKLP